MPNEARQYTGNGMPYFVPAWAFRIIGRSTTELPRKMVSTACFQSIPSAIIEEASVYVGMQADIEIHRAAISRAPHFLAESGVGAMSAFENSLSMTSRSGRSSIIRV